MARFCMRSIRSDLHGNGLHCNGEPRRRNMILYGWIVPGSMQKLRMREMCTPFDPFDDKIIKMRVTHGRR